MGMREWILLLLLKLSESNFSTWHYRPVTSKGCVCNMWIRSTCRKLSSLKAVTFSQPIQTRQSYIVFTEFFYYFHFWSFHECSLLLPTANPALPRTNPSLSLLTANPEGTSQCPYHFHPSCHFAHHCNTTLNSTSQHHRPPEPQSTVAAKLPASTVLAWLQLAPVLSPNITLVNTTPWVLLLQTVKEKSEWRQAVKANQWTFRTSINSFSYSGILEQKAYNCFANWTCMNADLSQ